MTDRTPLYPIYSGVPLPPNSRGRMPNVERHGLWAELLGLMQVGDMAVVPLKGRTAKSVQNTVVSTVKIEARRHGTTKKFATRTLPDGIGVWRVE